MKTSYFAKSGKFPKAVAITAYVPKWFTGRYYKPLAPPWFLVDLYKKGQIDEAEYERIYKEQVLSKLSPRQVVADFGGDAILLCFETPDKFCHRHIVAEWLMAAGIKCYEAE